MRRVISLLLAGCLGVGVLVGFSPVVSAAETFNAVTGKEMLGKLGIGINFGNTLEALPYQTHNAKGGKPDDSKIYGLDSETVWGETKIEPKHFKAIVKKGYKSVRLPVSWEPHMDLTTYKIDKAWLDRVEQCVKYAVAEGLYVIINFHHEDDFYILVDTGKTDAAKKELTELWRQVAERFKGYSEKVIFEVMNEPHRIVQGGWIWDNWNTGVGHVDEKLAERVNELNAAALAAIRATGGNNAKRVVSLTTPGASPDALALYKHPNDPYTMVGVFLYPDENKAIDAAIKGTDYYLGFIKAAMDKGIPIYIKEISPLSDKPVATEKWRLSWTKYAFDKLAKMGVPTFWWNCGGVEEGTLLFDRSDVSWKHADLLNAVFAAYGVKVGGDFITKVTSVFPYELKGPFKDNAFTFWTLPSSIRQSLGKITVETDGTVKSYMFSRHYPSEWTQYAEGDKRVTVSGKTITFDAKGTSGNDVGFAAWGVGAYKGIKKIYADITFDGSETAALMPFLREASANGLLPDALSVKFGSSVTRSDVSAFISPIMERKIGAKASTLFNARDVMNAKLTRKEAAAIFDKAAAAMKAKGWAFPLDNAADTFTRGDCVICVVALFGSVCDE